jgi:peptide/nickel transport system substrate-binding protein
MQLILRYITTTSDYSMFNRSNVISKERMMKLLRKGVLLPVAAYILMTLFVMACGSTEETTATTTTETVATATQVTQMITESATTPVRPEITAEIIDSMVTMSLGELFATFPATYEQDYEYSDIKRGGIFKLAVSFDIATWDTRRAAAGGTTSVGNVVYERLVQYEQGPGRDPDNPAIVADMAKEWAFNADGTQLTFHINEGMYWGDLDDPFQPGPEIVAEDFVYIITEYRDNSVHGGNYRTVESVEAPDAYTVVLNFNAPSFFILPFLASKDGLQFNPYLAKEDRMEQELIGPGPHILVSAKKSIEVKLERNPNHFMKDSEGNALPYLDGLHFLVVPDATTRVALLRTGKVDYAQVSGTPRDMRTLLRTNPDLQMYAQPGAGTNQMVSFQLNNPMWNDVNARRALALATDGKGISDVVYEGVGMPMDKYEWWYWSDVMPSWDGDLDAMYGEYNNHTDVARAQELWAATGLGDMTLDLPYYAYSQAYNDIMGILADDWRKIGITLNAKSQDYSAYNSTLQGSNADQMIFGWQQQAYDAVGVTLTRLVTGAPGNRENISNPVIDDLADKLLYESDPIQVRNLVTQIRAEYADKVYWVADAAAAFSAGTVVQPWVRGVRGGNYASLSYYYQGPMLRAAWLDK